MKRYTDELLKHYDRRVLNAIGQVNKPIPKLEWHEVARFWSKVAVRKPNECWEWQAGKYESGYGQFKTRGVGYKATRIAYSLSTGADPAEWNVLHTCDNRACCNPRHFWLGTLADNNKDRAKKGRSAINIFPSRGEDNGRAKLTEEDVLVIRASSLSNAALAEAYSMSDQMISRIRSKKAWAHVE